MVLKASGDIFPYALPNFNPLIACFYFAGPLPIRERFIAIALCGISTPVDPVTMIAFLLASVLGLLMGSKPVPALIGSFSSAVAFHLITCYVAWSNPIYPSTLDGLYQSCWSGPIGSSLPSWVFLRNSIASTTSFTIILLILRNTIDSRVIIDHHYEYPEEKLLDGGAH